MINSRYVVTAVVGALVLAACAPYEQPSPNTPSYQSPNSGPYQPPSGTGPYPASGSSGPYGPYESRGTVAPPPRYAVNTGVVSSIEILRGQTSSGVSPGGAILGAVVGGVLGNQIGAGSGKAVATGVGVVGGALAGNAIGNRVNSTTDMYRVGIQFDGGGYQYIDVTNPGDLRTGDRVRVDGSQISRY